MESHSVSDCGNCKHEFEFSVEKLTPRVFLIHRLRRLMFYTISLQSVSIHLPNDVKSFYRSNISIFFMRSDIKHRFNNTI